jgi:hypothetical protein
MRTAGAVFSETALYVSRILNGEKPVNLPVSFPTKLELTVNLSIGCSAALIARPGNAILPVHGLPQPQAVASDLPGVATQLISLWH